MVENGVHSGEPMIRGPGLPNQCKRLVSALMSAEVPDVTVWVGSREIKGKSSLHAHAVCLLNDSGRAVYLGEIKLALEAGSHCLHRHPTFLDTESFGHCLRILIPLVPLVG